MDSDRLIQCLTTVVDEGQDIAAIGIMEKGRICAEVMAFVRYAMYDAVYWHHAYRSLKAMIRFVAQLIAGDLAENAREDFRDEFREGVVLGKHTIGEQGALFVLVSEMEDPAFEHRPPDEVHLIGWLKRRAPKRGGRMIDHIDARQLYNRVLSVSPGRSSNLFAKMAQVFRSTEDTVEALRHQVENLLKKHLKEVAAKIPSPLSSEEISILTHFLADGDETLCLVDLPLERPTGGSKDALWYVSHIGSEPKAVEDSGLGKMLAEQFSTGVSKFRLFVHPDMKEIVQKCTSDQDLEKIL